LYTNEREKKRSLEKETTTIGFWLIIFPCEYEYNGSVVKNFEPCANSLVGFPASSDTDFWFTEGAFQVPFL
jgi:hypothetical protein